MSQIFKNSRGFTLLELMIVVVISSLVMITVNAFYQSFMRSTTAQEQITDMQQTARAAMHLLTQEVRTIGYDPTGSGLFGITDITFRDINNQPDAAAGFSSLTYTADLNVNGKLDLNETHSYSLFDFPVAAPNGDIGLSRNTGGGRTMLAENVEAFGLAYAYDTGTGNNKALNTAGGQIIWAIDSDNNNTLDRNLDSNHDGRIDVGDQPGANSRLIIGANITPPVALAYIRAIRIWILVKSERQDLKYYNNNTYVVGRNIIIPKDHFRRRLIEATVYCRNMGL